MKLKNFIARALVAVLLALGVAVSVEAFVYAQEREIAANLHIRVEASSDNGATWHNYSGTESSGGETISANPGDKILIRTKIWDDALSWYVTDLSGTGEVTNSSYIQTIAMEDADYDANTRSYTDYFYGNTTTGAIATVMSGGIENSTNCESLKTSFTLSNSFPTGETVITAKATIGSYTEHEFLPTLLNKLGIALAAGTGRNSTARIAVNVATTPTPTATPTETPTATPEVLPATGADTDSQNTAGFAASVASLTALALIYRLFRTIKKSA